MSSIGKIRIETELRCISYYCRKLKFNQMLHRGTFSDTLKVSKVIPLYKKDDKQLFFIYRSISLLPLISKTFERVILIQLTEYLNNNNILHKNQYGFRKHHSTDLASLH